MRIVISYLRITFDRLRIVGFAFGLSLSRFGAHLLLCLGGSLTFRKGSSD
ncbi:MAG: hypothetical protein PHW76_08175 [Alphaproteobacteria bacterium]|nr:hypothetical protein [Alphaproteobacteria bacterium]